MQNIKPKVVTVPTSGPFTGRNLKGVFLYKHNVIDNIISVAAEVEQAIDSNPKEYLMLPEGLHSYKCTENLYIDRMVDTLGFEAIDPIVKPFSAEVAYSANISNTQGALSVFVNYMDYVFGVDISKMDDEELQQWFDTKLKIVASAFDIRPEEIETGFEQLVRLDEKKKTKKIRELSNLLNALIRESNQQSRIKLLGILSVKKQPKLLVISGIAHEPVFCNVEI